MKVVASFTRATTSTGIASWAQAAAGVRIIAIASGRQRMPTLRRGDGTIALIVT